MFRFGDCSFLLLLRHSSEKPMQVISIRQQQNVGKREKDRERERKRERGWMKEWETVSDHNNWTVLIYLIYNGKSLLRAELCLCVLLLFVCVRVTILKNARPHTVSERLVSVAPFYSVCCAVRFIRICSLNFFLPIFSGFLSFRFFSLPLVLFFCWFVLCRNVSTFIWSILTMECLSVTHWKGNSPLIHSHTHTHTHKRIQTHSIYIYIWQWYFRWWMTDGSQKLQSTVPLI